MAEGKTNFPPGRDRFARREASKRRPLPRGAVLILGGSSEFFDANVVSQLRFAKRNNNWIGKPLTVLSAQTV
jgi:hypothetical protein